MQAMAQLRIRPKAIIAEGCGGTIFWTTPSRAQLLIAAGAAELVNATGPTEARVSGPSETKPAGPSEVKDSLEKKSYDIDRAGLSTDFPRSSEPGTDAQSSALPAGPLSQESNAPTLKRGPGRPRKGT